MILTIADYHRKYYPEKSKRTVYRMAKAKILPSNHIVNFSSSGRINIEIRETTPYDRIIKGVKQHTL